MANRYGLATACFSCFFLLCIGLFNWLIDPYLLMSSDDHLNDKKINAFFQIGQMKSYEFYNREVDSLILGSSRAGSAIDPDHQSLIGSKFYNFSTPGSSPDKDYLKLKSAVQSGKIKRVIYCVDFYAFNRFLDRGKENEEAFRKRLSRNGSLIEKTGFIQQYLIDYSEALWAFSTISKSYKILISQHSLEPSKSLYFNIKNNGLWYPVFPKNRIPLDAFRETEKTYVDNTWFQEKRRFSIDREEQAPSHPFDHFEALLELSHSNNINMTIIILPVHARMLESLSYAGLWENFELWKKQLVSLTKIAAKNNNKDTYQVWDFNGYYSFAIEDVPENNNSAPLKWVYDSSHTHVNTGNQILDIISGKAKEGFGSQINATNIDKSLVVQRQLRDNFREENSETVNEIEENVKKAFNEKPWSISSVNTLKIDNK